jgi:hypothetical protein
MRQLHLCAIDAMEIICRVGIKVFWHYYRWTQWRQLALYDQQPLCDVFSVRS